MEQSLGVRVPSPALFAQSAVRWPSSSETVRRSLNNSEEPNISLIIRVNAPSACVLSDKKYRPRLLKCFSIAEIACPVRFTPFYRVNGHFDPPNFRSRRPTKRCERVNHFALEIIELWPEMFPDGNIRANERARAAALQAGCTTIAFE